MRKVPPEKIGDFAEEMFNDLLHATVLECDARLKLGTPVDTGRMRNAWTIGQNKEANYANSPDQAKLPPTRDLQKARLIADSATQAVQINRTPQRYEGYERGKEKVGNSYVITNNMEYAEPIGFGTGIPQSWKTAGIKGSIQNPPNWVEPIAKGMQKWINDEFGRMSKSSKY